MLGHPIRFALAGRGSVPKSRARWLAARTLAVLALFAARPAPAQPGIEDEGSPRISATVSAVAVSSYVSRGCVLTEGFAFQPGLILEPASSRTQLAFWGSFAMQDRERFNGADEFDVTLSTHRDLLLAGHAGEFTLGLTQYTFPGLLHEARLSEEFFAGFSLESRWSPSLVASYDFDQMDATYLSASLDPEFTIGAGGDTSLLLSAALGAGDYGISRFGFIEWGLTATLSRGAGPVQVSPMLGYRLMRRELHEERSAFFGGIGFEMTR